MPIGRLNCGTYSESPAKAFIFDIIKPEYLKIMKMPMSVSTERVSESFARVVPRCFSIDFA